MKLRAATRASPLARAQAKAVARALENLGHQVTLIPVVSHGDRDSSSLRELGGQGVFTAAVSAAVVAGDADFAVHSLKDLPTSTDPGLVLAAVPLREDPRDVLVTRSDPNILSHGAHVGTGSLRRRLQLTSWRADLNTIDLRGNVETRLQRVVEGDLEAVLLAAAGLQRLKEDDPSVLEQHLVTLVFTPLDPAVMTPAVGQGALGLECRRADPETATALSSLDHAMTHREVNLERRLLKRFGGGCQVPFAAHASHTRVRLMLGDPSSGQCWRCEGPADQADKLFEKLSKSPPRPLRGYPQV